MQDEYRIQSPLNIGKAYNNIKCGIGKENKDTEQTITYTLNPHIAIYHDPIKGYYTKRYTFLNYEKEKKSACFFNILTVY